MLWIALHTHEIEYTIRVYYKKQDVNNLKYIYNRNNKK